MSDRATRNSILGGIVVLLLLAVGGGLLIEAFITRERDRDLTEWESRLGLAAEARAEAVARLLARDQRALDELAGNAALQAYFGQLVAGVGPAGADEPAERGYLRNLLLTTATRDGWTDTAAAAVPADVGLASRAGLALIDSGGGAVIQTPGLAALAPVLAAAAAERPGISLRDTPDGEPVLMFTVPVMTVLGADAAGGSRRIGTLVGVRNPAVELYPLLTRGPAFAEDSEALLLAAAGDGVLYLAPTRDGFGELHRTVPLVRARLAEAAAVRNPDAFVALDNHAGRPVLQASRRVRGQPWVVAQQVDAGQALALADERRGFLLLALGLLLVAILALAVSAWRHGSSVRARREAAASRAQADALGRQTALLRTIADNSDAATLLVDRARVVRFSNRAAASLAGAANLDDQALGSQLPANLAQALANLADTATRTGARCRELVTLPVPDAPLRVQVSAIPVPALGPDRDLVLFVLQDVTELEAARQRHDDLLRDLVRALADAVDRHDPYGRELGLDAADQANLELAATLANVGKVELPPALLGKAGPLDDAERALLRSHVGRSLELLKGLAFDGPVLEVIAQKQEHLDGSGYPRGIGGAALSLPGRILAVANAYVALASPRAYRAGLPPAEAAAVLLRDAGTRYDPRVLAALLHLVETRTDWAGWRTPPPVA